MKKQNVQIRAVAHAVPKQVVSNDDLAKIMETSDEWIRSRTGIERRHISRDEQTSDLATRVAEDLLAQSNLTADALDFIVVATISPDSAMPSTAALVQSKIGASKAFAYDLVAACSGFTFALSTAEKLIQSGVYQTGLVIGAEVLSKFVDWNDRSTAVLFGDGAGGVLLTGDGKKSLIVAEKMQTDGSRGEKLASNLTGLSSPFSASSADAKHLTMEGRAIFDFAVRDVTQNIKQTIERSSVPLEEVDYFLLHQANSRILDKMSKKIGAKREKFLQNMEEYGNTSAASIPILLSENVKNGKIRLDGSQKIVLTGFGGGLTWGTLILSL